MLHKANTLNGYKLGSLDGEIGKVKEFYFDDHYWTIRYLVADTGNWLVGRQVLISPHSLRAVNTSEQKIDVALTKKQIEDSPSLESDKPVSRQFEEAYHGYYGWPLYWGGSFMWGTFAYPYLAGPYPGVAHEREERAQAAQNHKQWDPHLRSTKKLSGRHIQAVDGEIGHIEDFIIDDQTWAIRYLIIDTRNWWRGKRVLIAPKWIESAAWNESKVFLNLTRQAIRQAPEYTDESLLNRDYEAGLHQHYNRQGYWVDEPPPRDPSR